MVAIVVVLASTTALFLTGFGDELQAPPGPVTFDSDYHPDGGASANGAYVNLTYTGGNAVSQEQVFIKDDAGNQVQWDDVWTADSTDRIEPGEYVHIDGHGSDGALRPVCDAGQRYLLVFDPGDGMTTVVGEFVVPTRATDRTNC